MMHTDEHPLAGQTVDVTVHVDGPALDAGEPKTEVVSFTVLDWADRVWDASWRDMDGNPTAMIYGFRAGYNLMPNDDEVVYGKVHGLAYLVHATEFPVQHAGQ